MITIHFVVTNCLCKPNYYCDVKLEVTFYELYVTYVESSAVGGA